MSKYSVCYKGEVLDFKYKKTPNHFEYNFYVGDIFLGKIFNMGRSWTAVPMKRPLGITVKGLKTRHDAAEFLIEWTDLYDERRKEREEYERISKEVLGK